MEKRTRTVVVPHLGRVEGHGGIFVRLSGTEVEDVNMSVHEGSRYYETLLLGKHFLEVQGIITRVCAICSGSHTVAALTALENALGIKPSDRIHHLRGLLVLGGMIESHALHIFALALPDFLGFDSVMSMASSYPQEVTFALKLKQLGNRIQGLVGGRAIHPINTLVGGFGTLPRHAQLRELRAALAETLEPLMRFLDVATSIEVPLWAESDTVYMALRPYEDDAFRFRGKSLCTSRGDEYAIEDYAAVVREYSVEHSHAKHAALASGETYMVGSLARLQLFGDRLTKRAKEGRDRLFPNGVKSNILLNNWAQLVELIFSIERGIELCELLLQFPEDEAEMCAYEVRAGRGIGALEVPRGTLFHDYTLDKDGRVVAANVITPTAQNLANVERDLRAAVTGLMAADSSIDDARLELDLAMITRAYDPCISCSVHVVRAENQ